jgi:hypothetical protein
MEIKEMADLILKTLRDESGATFLELVNACGDEARGNGSLHFEERPNSILWAGTSDKFCEAFNLVKEKLDIRSTSYLSYAWSGSLLRIPVPTDQECHDAHFCGDFKEERWLPTVLTIKPEFKNEAVSVR